MWFFHQCFPGISEMLMGVGVCRAMLARFFNDYEEIKDSTNKNSVASRLKAQQEAAAAAAAEDGDVDMIVQTTEDVEDEEDGGVKLAENAEADLAKSVKVEAKQEEAMGERMEIG